MLNYLARKLRDRVIRRPPDVKIGGDGTVEGCYMQRWWVIPRNHHFNVYLHKFQHDDDDRALHCHPWWNISYLIEGSYIERTPNKDRPGTLPLEWQRRKAGFFYFRKATAQHRVECSIDGYGNPAPCWTLFITGPNVRTWGFYCRGPNGLLDRFVDWKTFTGVDHNKTGSGPAPGRKNGVGRGCGENMAPL